MALIGLVKWFDPAKAFGVVLAPSGEYFLHINAFTVRPEKIEPGVPVIFESQFDRRKQRNNADNARMIGDPNDFEIAIQHFASTDKVSLEVTISGTSRGGNSYRRKENQDFSVTEIALSKFARALPSEILLEKLKAYFSNKLNKTNIRDCIKLCNRAFSSPMGLTTNGRKHLKVLLQSLGPLLDDDTLLTVWRNNEYTLFFPSDEIPMRILCEVKEPFTNSDIWRIKRYSYWPEFFNHLIEHSTSSILSSSSNNFSEYYSLLSSLSASECDQFKKAIEPSITARIQNEVTTVLKRHGQFKSESDIGKLQELINLIPYQLDGSEKSNLKNWIGKIALENVDSTLLGPLWMKNIVSPFPEDKIPHIIQTWSSTDKKFIIAALHRIKRNDGVRLFESGLYFIVKSHEWTSDEAWEIYTANSALGMEILPSYFSFSGSSVISRLETLLENGENKELIEHLKNRFRNEMAFLDAETIISIFGLTDFNPFEAIDDFLSTLVNKEIHYMDYQNLLELDPKGFDYDLMSTITQSALIKESFNTRLECFQQVQDNTDLARPILAILFEGINEDSKSRCHKEVIDLLEARFSEKLCKVYLDRYGKEVGPFYPHEVFDFAIKCGDSLNSAQAYSLLLFSNVKQFVNFVKEFGRVVLDSTFGLRNPGLTSCLQYFINNSTFDDIAFGFIANCKGRMQTFIIKSFIYKFSFGKLSRGQLENYLNRFLWTEISVVVIRAFIKSAAHGEKVILSSLQSAVKEHFEILNGNDTVDLDKEFIKQNFAIGNVLSRCDGRKFYNVTRPTSTDPKRYYEGEVSLTYRDSMDCFCEGVPWKKEIFYDKESGNRSEEEFELYWCRGNVCAARNDSFDPKSGYDKWTITEIAKILNIQIEKVTLAKMAGWANKMNNIVDRLFCRSCNSFLRPILNYSKFLGVSPIPLFSCQNSQCSEHQKPIRFTHCLSGKCPSHLKSLPLDSRDCEHCHTEDSYNWGLTCNFCGSSCPKCEKKPSHVISQEVW